VCAKWKSGKWFLSHVYDITDDRCYRVYCPVDGAKKKVSTDEIRELDEHERQNIPSRSGMVRDNVQFVYDGDDDIPAGTVWRVRKCNHKKNEFVCVRMGEGAGLTLTTFDIAYVMNQVEYQERSAPFQDRFRVQSRLRRKSRY